MIILCINWYNQEFLFAEGHTMPLTEEEFDKMKAKKEKASSKQLPPSLRFFERKKAEKEQLRKVFLIFVLFSIMTSPYPC